MSNPVITPKKIENCEKKPRHTKKEAQTIRNYEHRHHSNILYVYQCEVCNHYHLTHHKQ